MSATKRLLALIAIEGAAIWDVQIGVKGLTVILEDGRVVPLKMSADSARTLHHGFCVEADQAAN